MHSIRRKDKEITEEEDLKTILKEAKHVTLAMSLGDEPYLATLSFGYNEEQSCIYFHSALEGRKVEILKANPRVWGQALIDDGYQQGSCDHLYRTTQFYGRVTFVDDPEEKMRALCIMIRHLDEKPEKIIAEQLTSHSTGRILVGRIDIDYISGKKADKINIQL